MQPYALLFENRCIAPIVLLLLCQSSEIFPHFFSNALQDRLFTNKRDVAISIFWVMHTLKMFVQVHSRYSILLLKSPLFMKLTTTKFKRKHLILQSKLGLHTFEQVPLRGTAWSSSTEVTMVTVCQNSRKWTLKNYV